MKAPLLVVAHEATRTGSPRVLLDLLRYVCDRLPVPIAVRLLAEGPLASELRSLATADRLTSPEPAALLVNSAAATATALEYPVHIPALAYVHEEGEALSLLSPACRSALAERFQRVLCVSERAHGDLLRLGVPEDRLSVLPPVVDTRPEPVGAPADPVASGPLVIGCGEAGWRKGADLFIDVVRRTATEQSVRFAWAGRRPRAFARLLDNDTAAAGVADTLQWLDEVDDLAPLFSRAHLLVMTSREDPQPLVPLEAARFGVATAGFSIGGLADLGDVGAAATVEYPDTPALTDLILSLLDDPDRRDRLARAARTHAETNHAIDDVGERFLEQLRELLGLETT